MDSIVKINFVFVISPCIGTPGLELHFHLKLPRLLHLLHKDFCIYYFESVDRASV